MRSGKGLARATAVLALAVISIRCVGAGTVDLYTDQPVSVQLPSDITTLNLRGTGTGIQVVGGMDDLHQLNKYDSGSWVLGGNIGGVGGAYFLTSRASATVNIWDGQLTVFSDLYGQATVHQGARLEGVFYGRFNFRTEISVESGGTYAPGFRLPYGSRSTPTMTLETDVSPGTLTLAPGSTLEIQANYSTNTQFTVTDNASLAGTLSVKDLSGGTRRQPIHFMDVTGAVVGAFDRVVDDSATLDYTLRSRVLYSDSAVTTEFYLDIWGLAYAQSARTPNQRNVAAALDAVYNSGQISDLTDALDLLSEPELQTSFDSLSPGHV